MNLFDSILLYKRDGSLIYHSNQDGLYSPKAILEKELYSQPTNEILVRANKIKELMDVNKHDNTEDYARILSLIEEMTNQNK